MQYGNYELVEQCTAYGYVLSKEPVPFKVDGTQTVVTVEKYNVAQKGTITVSKSGEIFSSVAESDGIYQPIYAVSGLAGAVYEIYAAQDIVTLDGTVRAKRVISSARLKQTRQVQPKADCYTLESTKSSKNISLRNDFKS